jgi:hypothetical protein
MGCPLTNLTSGGEGLNGFRKLTEKDQEAIVLMYARDCTQQMLADEFAVSQRTIHLTLRRFGAVARNLIESHGGIPKDDERKVLELYKTGLTAKAIVLSTGFSVASVYGLLRRSKTITRVSPRTMPILSQNDVDSILLKRLTAPGQAGARKIAADFKVGVGVVYRVLQGNYTPRSPHAS